MPLYRVGDTWYVDLPSSRGRIRRSAKTTDKAQAKVFHDALKEQLWKQDQLGEEPPITWAAAVKKWMDVKQRSLPERYMIRSFSVDANTSLPMPTTVMERLLSGTSAGTFNRRLGLITAIHSASGLKPPAIKRRPNPKGRTRWLAAEEWERLRKALEEESPLLRQAAEFTLATGLRENNVLNLEWEQVDLKRRVAWIHADQAKGGDNIGVPLNEAACAVLRERVGADRRLVFGNPDYCLVKASNRAWYNALRKAKLRGFRWHDLRHTWASWAVMSGVRLEELMRLGGWKSYQMVLRYAHLAPEHLAEAASKVGPVSRK
jgi:integrase